MSKNKKNKLIKAIGTALLAFVLVFFFSPDEQTIVDIFGEETGSTINTITSIFNGESDSEISYENFESLEDIPSWDGKTAYVAINNNTPAFSDADKSRLDAFEEYAKLDRLGRCGVAYANICKDLMPTDKREDISSVYPSGWKLNGKSNNNEYDTELVDGGRIYNRCHLIGFQLAGENANKLNLITGTRYLNIEGMLPFENMIDDYVDETNNHVLYRVTPIYNGDELVPRGVQMEAWSVEDNGDGVCFNVYAYNAQPGIEIDYATGENWLI